MLIRIRTVKQIVLVFDRADEGTLILEVGIVSSVTLIFVGATNTVADDGQNLPGSGFQA